MASFGAKQAYLHVTPGGIHAFGAEYFLFTNLRGAISVCLCVPAIAGTFPWGVDTEPNFGHLEQQQRVMVPMAGISWVLTLSRGQLLAIFRAFRSLPTANPPGLTFS